MPRVTLTGYIRVPLDDLDAVCAELPNHIMLTRQEPGCLRFEVIQSSDDPTIFHVDEEFSNPDSFKQHQLRVHSSRWGEITSKVERDYEVTGMPD